MAEIRCLSDHQDQIRCLINVNGQSTNNQREQRGSSHSEALIGSPGQPASDTNAPSLPLDRLFASGSHAGELILWDAVDWSYLAYEHILWEESQSSTNAEIRLNTPKPSEMSIQHLCTNGKVNGIYVYINKF